MVRVMMKEQVSPGEWNNTIQVRLGEWNKKR